MSAGSSPSSSWLPPHGGLHHACLREAPGVSVGDAVDGALQEEVPFLHKDLFEVAECPSTPEVLPLVASFVASLFWR